MLLVKQECKKLKEQQIEQKIAAGGWIHNAGVPLGVERCVWLL